MALFNFRHGLIVLLSLGRLIELRVAQRDVDRAVSHQLFEDFERDAGVEQLCREGVTQAVSQAGIVAITVLLLRAGWQSEDAAPSSEEVMRASTKCAFC
jgi:hypothetical protein